ncbi:MAG: hypothetical protein ABEK50_06185, partial [bacterium]
MTRSFFERFAPEKWPELELNIPGWIVFFSLYPALSRGFRYFFYRAFPWYSGWEVFTTASPLLNSVGYWGCALATVLVVVPPFLLWSELRWSTFTIGGIRWGVTLLAFLYAWDLAFGGYNFFYDQGYVLDRLILVSVAVLVYRHPGFLAPLLVAGLGFSSQFRLTFTSQLLPHGYLLLECLLLFLSFLFVRSYLRVNDRLLLFGLLWLPIGFLFHEGTDKLLAGSQWLDWVLKYRPGYASAWARTQGWWAFLPPDYSSSLIYSLKTWGNHLPHAFQWVSLAAPAALLGYGVTMFYLGFSLAILGILFGLVGFLLWKWMAVVLVVSVLTYLNKGRFFDFLSGKRLIAAIVLVLLPGLINLSPDRELTLWQTRYLSRVDIQPVDPQGNRHRLSPQAFRPYQLSMGLSAHQLRTVLPVPSMPSATSDFSIAQILNSML